MINARAGEQVPRAPILQKPLFAKCIVGKCWPCSVVGPLTALMDPSSNVVWTETDRTHIFISILILPPSFLLGWIAFSHSCTFRYPPLPQFWKRNMARRLRPLRG